VLGGDSKWKRLLDEEQSSSRSLREDAEADYAGYLRVGELAADLTALVVGPEPTSEREANAMLKEISTFVRKNGDSPLVKRKERTLRKRERDVAGLLFDLEGVEKVMRGRLARGKDGRILMTYSFEDGKEFDDFEVDAEYLRDERGRYPEPRRSSPGELSLDDGVLQGSGATCLRTLVDFAAPFTVTCRYTVDAPSGDVPAELNVGVCDDGRGRFAWVMNTDRLEVRDGHNRGDASEDTPARAAGGTYEVELRHDGERIRSFLDGTEVGSSPCRLQSGALFLWMLSDPTVRVDEVRIDAAELPTSYDRLRAEWVERRLE
jgi:hypothetical protein